MSSSSILALLHLAAQARPDNGLTFVQAGSETKITYAQLWHLAQVSRLFPPLLTFRWSLTVIGKCEPSS